jgi:hypothetical protein
MKKAFKFIGVAVMVVFAYGCIGKPPAYKMPPEKLDQIRSDLGVIGVVVYPFDGEVTLRKPAKGKSGGAKVGLIYGAMMPPLVGFVAPVPMGTAVGALAAPVGAVAGAIYGTYVALPVEAVEHAEASVGKAVDKALAGRVSLRERFADEMIRIGRERAGLQMVPLHGIDLDAAKKGLRYDRLELDKVDSILEVRVYEAGLWGFLSIDPLMYAFIDFDIRLIDRARNKELLAQKVICIGEELKFREWAVTEGRQFYSFFMDGPTQSAEKIIEDLFLVESVK